MLKIIGSIMIIASSTAFGFIHSNKFKQRNCQLKEMQRIIYQIENDIVYTHTPLPEAMFSAADKAEFPLNKLFHSIGNFLSLNQVDSVYRAFVLAFKETKEYLKITQEDMDIVFNLGKHLGDSDIEGHKKVFSIIHNNLERQINDSEISIKKNVKMYRYLGFSLGSIIVIILI